MENSDIIIPVIAGTVLIGTFFVFIGYFVYLHYKTRQTFDWERQQLKQALLQTEVEIREQTLIDISRELHDNFGQIASLIKINLNLISDDLSREDKIKVTESISLLKRMITDIKSLSVSLNVESLSNIGLQEAIQLDVQRINKTGYLQITVTNSLTPPVLSTVVATFLYRITQEIINNTMKHANAGTLQISFSCLNHMFMIDFKDNGKGFDYTSDASNTGHTGSGLNNIKERCKMIGAAFTIESQPGSGTHILISLPI